MLGQTTPRKLSSIASRPPRDPYLRTLSSKSPSRTSMLIAKGGLLTSFRDKEIMRLEWIVRLDAGAVTNQEVQSALGLSRPHVYRILTDYRRKGAVALRSKQCRRVSNNAYPAAFRQTVLDLAYERYRDFGPTLLSEVLAEFHSIHVAVETLRQWMIARGLWSTKRAERRRLHQPRKRMSCYGDLVQVDGSDHRWFEDRGPKCTLMVYTDDATGRLQWAMFTKSETADAYMLSTCGYIRHHGRPQRILTDRHKGAWLGPDPASDYTLGLRKLVIVHSVAYSAESKGRVERMNRTLQDRLVKHMRLEDISTIEQANAYLPTFMKEFNAHFGREPACGEDAHRPFNESLPPEAAFTKQHSRKLTRQLSFQFDSRHFVIDPDPSNWPLVGKVVSIEIALDGRMSVLAGKRKLIFREV